MNAAGRAAVVWLALAGAGLAGEASDAPPRDAKSWGLLIEAAKARGGAETKLDKSSSYVFQQEDGDYLTLTEWRSAPAKRFVCLIAKDQKSTVCVRWETGQTTYGEKADAASPWNTRVATPLEETRETTPAGRLLSKIGDFVGGAMGFKVHYVFGRPAP